LERTRLCCVVMPGFMPGIHAFLNLSFNELKTWMAGTSPAMTVEMRCHAFCVMPALAAGIHVFTAVQLYQTNRTILDSGRGSGELSMRAASA